MVPKLGLILALFLACLPATALASRADAEEALSGTLSTNWAGYSVSGGKYTAVGAAWAVPAPQDATSSSLATDATWVGIGGIKKSDLIQAGTQAIVKSGRVTYRAWYELLPEFQKQIPLDIHGGDSVSVSIVEFAPDMWLISFNNTTTGGSFYKAVEYESSKTSAEWIEEMPRVETGGVRVYAPLDKFDTVAFTGGYAVSNGAQKTIEATKAHTITMVAKNIDIAIATPSAVAGGSFTVTRSSATAKPAKSGKGEITWSRGK